MLTLNGVLEKVEESLKTRFWWVKYLLSRAVSAFFIKKSNTGSVIYQFSNILIQVAIIIDQAIIKVEILEHLHRLKMHRMSLKKYLDKKSMEVLKCEVKSSTSI